MKLPDVQIPITPLQSWFRARTVATLAFGAIAFATTACGCTLGIGSDVEPRSITLRVGQSFTPKGKVVSSCPGGDESDTWSFTSSDSTVVRIVSAKGPATGAAPGTATLLGRTTVSGAPNVTVTVTVIP